MIFSRDGIFTPFAKDLKLRNYQNIPRFGIVKILPRKMHFEASKYAGFKGQG